uniref:UV-B-induced protein At3g17800, chloroplastic n=1 Tax=Araucaria cunninghamii TaxID=56994 RepID=A0A0D6R3H1_ARACU
MQGVCVGVDIVGSGRWCGTGINVTGVPRAMAMAISKSQSGFSHGSPFSSLKFSTRGKNWGGACSKRRKEKVGVRVRAGGNEGESCKRIAPLQLESPTGQLLSQLLTEHPHLLPAAVDQQLERIIADRDADAQQGPPSTTGTELILYRRIAELKAAERQRTLEEIIYALIVQKFMDAGVSLIPNISTSDPITGRVDTWSKQDHKLERVHSPEAFEMIKNHLALVFGNRMLDTNAIAQIGKLRVGQVYAASVMYGYFLRRVDQRFQLEERMKALPFGLNEEADVEQFHGSDPKHEDKFQMGSSSGEIASSTGPGRGTASEPEFDDTVFGGGRVKPCKLKSYVVSFDQETLQRYTTMRSKEGVSIIDRHSEALFGRPAQILSGSVAASNDETIRISFSGLISLVLEAVTFGSFLWDVESYVDSRCHFVTN